MKRSIFTILLLCVFSFLVNSCEDVIEVETPSIPPKLVIEASLNWFKNTSGNNQQIKLSLTAPYFENSIPPATGATVTVTDGNGSIFNFIETDQTGIYATTSFIPEIDQSYNLTVVYDGETYVGTETLKSVVPINRVEQNEGGGFEGNSIELKAYYTDPAEEGNNYLFQFIKPANQHIALQVYDDEFTNGNEIFGFYDDENLAPGNEVDIVIYGISERFYQFMFILLQQNNDVNGDPFEVQPATIRGNCVNITNPENFPLGYFRVSEAHQFNYTVE